MKALLRALPILALVIPACGDDDNGNGTPATTPDISVAPLDLPQVEETAPEVEQEVAPETVDAASEATEEVAEEVAEETSVPACVPTEPACQDEQIQGLAFSDEASGGDITEEGTTPGVFITHVDATAGGFNGTGGYTYARFTPNGLEKVDISDEESLESTEWDIALRRFVLRLNSGVSGPSCVLGGRTGPATEFDALDAVPSTITFRVEQYFEGESCEFVPDTSGIGAAQTLLSSFWTYPGCVKMTGNVYVVQLADGRHVKLQVLSYYTPEVQEGCDEREELTMPSGSGNYRIKWAFID